MQLLVRWTIGEGHNSRGRRIADAAYDMLELSVINARQLFPNADFILGIAPFRLSGTAKIIKLANKLMQSHQLNYFDSTIYAKQNKNSTENFWNPYWKAYPRRYNIKKHELRLDNDVILWCIPSQMMSWLDDEKGMLVTGSTSGSPSPLDWGETRGGVLGNAAREMYDKNLHINSGIVGYPPNFLPPAIPKRNLSWKNTEQGWTTLTFAQYDGPKYVIPFEDVPLIGFDEKIMVSTEEHIISERCGAHFVGHNIGHGTYFQDYFEKQIRQHTEAINAQH